MSARKDLIIKEFTGIINQLKRGNAGFSVEWTGGFHEG
jgi:hypothetical protein